MTTNIEEVALFYGTALVQGDIALDCILSDSILSVFLCPRQGLLGKESETCCGNSASLLQRCPKTSNQGCGDDRWLAGARLCDKL